MRERYKIRNVIIEAKIKAKKTNKPVLVIGKFKDLIVYPNGNIEEKTFVGGE